MPDGLTDLTVQRIVVRNGLGMDLADRLLDDIREACDQLNRESAQATKSPRPSFHH
jgi:glutamate decarboxylase